MTGSSEITVLRAGHPTRVQHGTLSHLLQARHPVVYFSMFIGDAVLTLPTLRAFKEMFAAPMTFVCPQIAYELCFWELSSRFVDITANLPVSRSSGPVPNRILDHESVVAEIGSADLFINAVPWDLPTSGFARSLVQHLSPATSIGFPAGDGYDIVVPRDVPHAADLSFKLARLFDPAMRIENYAQPVPLRADTREKIRSLRAALPAGTKVLVVHADSQWLRKCWPVTRFIDVLDRFLSGHADYVAWIVGMGSEDLDVGRERDRVFAYLNAPLDFSIGMVAAADLFLGIDSSMLHAADLAGTPGVGLFSPTSAATWGFRFAPHRHIETGDMADITVAEVLCALEGLAAEHGGRRSPCG